MFATVVPAAWIFGFCLVLFAVAAAYVVIMMPPGGKASNLIAVAIVLLLCLANYEWWFGHDLAQMKRALLAVATLMSAELTLVVFWKSNLKGDYVRGMYTLIMTLTLVGVTTTFGIALWHLWQGRSEIAWDLCYRATLLAVLISIPRIFGGELRWFAIYLLKILLGLRQQRFRR